MTSLLAEFDQWLGHVATDWPDDVVNSIRRALDAYPLLLECVQYGVQSLDISGDVREMFETALSATSEGADK